jgi:hypothetical protein
LRNSRSASLESIRKSVTAIDAYLPKIEAEGCKTVQSHDLTKSVYSFW